MAASVGAPRKHDRKKVAQDFIAWARDNANAFTVPQFATQHGFSSQQMIQWCHEDEEFRESYMVGKELIGINRLNATDPDAKKKLDKTIYLKGVANYDYDHKIYEREEKAFEAGLRTPEKNVIADDIRAIAQAITDSQ